MIWSPVRRHSAPIPTLSERRCVAQRPCPLRVIFAGRTLTTKGQRMDNSDTRYAELVLLSDVYPA